MIAWNVGFDRTLDVYLDEHEVSRPDTVRIFLAAQFLLPGCACGAAVVLCRG